MTYCLETVYTAKTEFMRHRRKEVVVDDSSLRATSVVCGWCQEGSAVTAIEIVINVVLFILFVYIIIYFLPPHERC